MQAVATLLLIFTRAIRNVPDDRSISLQMADLVGAFGQEGAERLAGRPLDLEGAKQRAEATRKEQLDALRKQQAELQQLVAAGIPDSRRELGELNKLIARLQAGQLNVTSLVSVQVGDLRAAVVAATPPPEA